MESEGLRQAGGREGKRKGGDDCMAEQTTIIYGALMLALSRFRGAGVMNVWRKCEKNKRLNG